MTHPRNWLNIVNKVEEESAEIFIDGTIGSYWNDNKEVILRKEEMLKQLKSIAELQVKKITVHINSYGGDVNHGVSIHDLLANHSAEVTTIVNGHTASAATIISQAGNIRKMSDNALFLVHNASAMAWGDKNELKTTISDLEKVDGSMANIYAKRTGKTVEEVLELMNKFNGRGEWLTAEEAKADGFIDEIFEPMKAVACVDKEMLLRFGLPEIPENKLNIQNQFSMKKFPLLTLAAIAAFFGKKNSEEIEITPEDMQKLNDELNARSESITNLTSERDTALANLATEKTAKETAEASLTTANESINTKDTEITALKAQVATLKAIPGAESKNIVSSTEKAEVEKAESEEKIKLASMSIPERIAYMSKKD